MIGGYDMMSFEELISIPQDKLPEEAQKLDCEEIAWLVDKLTLKEDKPRYQAFLLLKNRSAVDEAVYQYWDVFRGKLTDDNSYQRSIGLMLIAENVRWDGCNKMKDTLEDFLQILKDEKPITVRQCIQSLQTVIEVMPELGEIIADRLITLDITSYKETMRKLILMDALQVLLVINRQGHNPKIESFIFGALTGDILDKKSKKLIEAQL